MTRRTTATQHPRGRRAEGSLCHASIVGYDGIASVKRHKICICLQLLSAEDPEVSWWSDAPRPWLGRAAPPCLEAPCLIAAHRRGLTRERGSRTTMKPQTATQVPRTTRPARRAPARLVPNRCCLPLLKEEDLSLHWLESGGPGCHPLRRCAPDLRRRTRAVQASLPPCMLRRSSARNGYGLTIPLN